MTLGPRAYQFRRLPFLYNTNAISPEMPPPSRTQRPWSDIPLELAGLVLSRLPSLVDRFRFAAVCQQWRAAAREVPPPSPPLPLLVLPDGTAYSFHRCKPFRLPACAGYAGASGNWLLYSNNHVCFLWDPLTNATVPLPALFRFCLLHTSGDHAAATTTTGDPPTVTRFLISCSPHLIAAVVRLGVVSRVAVCKPGSSSWWSICKDENVPLISDMVIHHGRLFGVCFDSNHLFAVDVSVDQRTGHPWVSGIRPVIQMTFGSAPLLITRQGQETMAMVMVYLVESRGALLMVRRAMHGRFGETTAFPFSGFLASGRNTFQVFEADFEQAQWTKVTTVENDQVLFVSGRQCRSFSVSQFGMRGDRIVFFENDDEEHIHWYDKEGSCSCSVYDMRDGRVFNPLPDVSWKRGTVRATWLFPQG